MSEFKCKQCTEKIVVGQGDNSTLKTVNVSMVFINPYINNNYYTGISGHSIDGYRFWQCPICKRGTKQLFKNNTAVELPQSVSEHEIEKYKEKVTEKCRQIAESNKKYYQAKKEAETKGSNCFLATAVYGEPSNEVEVLRHFRDEYLAKNKTGRAFITFYVKTSPQLAMIIKKSNLLKLVTRWLIVSPAVIFSKFYISHRLRKGGKEFNRR